MVKEHAPSPFAACRHCGVPEEFLRNNFVCGLCDAYSESLEDHLKVHYQDSTGPRALMECRKCCKKFRNMASAHQCPVCYSTMGTRKAFRLHIVEKHLMKNPEEMLHSPAFGFLNPAVRQELRLWLPSYSCTGDAEIQVKKEVKQEIVD
ncbi:unnamed protein product [Nippostrongylus brasiliensis]|uniref:C2H2-type domain-containing protein n=1 Tax=Nippostrongylus brasiliensis TaxID=27835 RepID=A0A0N4XFD0_NIPBR|nr:unnamed protein product [Nippostrongylus brasiliensis]